MNIRGIRGSLFRHYGPRNNNREIGYPLIGLRRIYRECILRLKSKVLVLRNLC